MPTLNTHKETFAVTGMGCASCALKIEKALSAQKGVKESKVNYANSSVEIEFDPKIIKSLELKTITQNIGYDLIIDDNNQKDIIESTQKKEHTRLTFYTIAAAILAIPVVILGMFFMHIQYINWVMLGFTIPVIGFFGRRFFISTYKQLKHFTANMDTLVAVSTGIAFLFSLFNTIYPEFWENKGLEVHVYYEAVAATIAFILLGKWLEDKAKANTSTALKKLIGLQPKTVIRISSDGTEKEVPISTVQAGDMLLVRPGDKIPVDGTVQNGSSFVDESTITGEPIPSEKFKGQKVFAGTINQKGSFGFIAEKVGNQTVLGNIIKMVQEAQNSKAPVQKLVDKIAAIFVPVIIGISILTFVIWILIGGEDAFIHALITSITVLVIACPCALGLATPTAIMVGIGKGAENHILIKDAESLESAHKVNAIILDKTGTITEGKPTVTNSLWHDSSDQQHVKDILSAIEKRSEHPLAEAIVEYLQNENSVPVSIENFKSITGRGVTAIIKNESYFVGNRQLIIEHKIPIIYELEAEANKLQLEGKTVIFFANEKNVLAILAVSDNIKSTSQEAVTLLQEQGINVYMLTGDNHQTAETVAKQVGIKYFKAEVMPSEKADFVKELQQQGFIVAMVGDGINDSHALAQADLSIAMGKGSDIAIDVAKITLINSDLKIIVKALLLSKKTVITIKQNLFWAFIYNLIGIPIAAGVLFAFNGFLLNPMIAAAAMAFSSVSVVLNSLRLNRIKLQ